MNDLNRYNSYLRYLTGGKVWFRKTPSHPPWRDFDKAMIVIGCLLLACFIAALQRLFSWVSE